MAHMLPHCDIYNSIIVNDSFSAGQVKRFPVLKTAQTTFTFTSLADLFYQTTSQLLWEASSHTAINAQRLHIQIATISTARYSFTQLSELEQCRVKNMFKVKRSSTGFEPRFSY